MSKSKEKEMQQRLHNLKQSLIGQKNHDHIYTQINDLVNYHNNNLEIEEEKVDTKIIIICIINEFIYDQDLVTAKYAGDFAIKKGQFINDDFKEIASMFIIQDEVTSDTLSVLIKFLQNSNVSFSSKDFSFMLDRALPPGKQEINTLINFFKQMDITINSKDIEKNIIEVITKINENYQNSDAKAHSTGRYLEGMKSLFPLMNNSSLGKILQQVSKYFQYTKAQEIIASIYSERKTKNNDLSDYDCDGQIFLNQMNFYELVKRESNEKEITNFLNTNNTPVKHDFNFYYMLLLNNEYPKQAELLLNKYGHCLEVTKTIFKDTLNCIPKLVHVISDKSAKFISYSELKLFAGGYNHIGFLLQTLAENKSMDGITYIVETYSNDLRQSQCYIPIPVIKFAVESRKLCLLLLSINNEILNQGFSFALHKDIELAKLIAIEYANSGALNVNKYAFSLIIDKDQDLFKLLIESKCSDSFDDTAITELFTDIVNNGITQLVVPMTDKFDYINFSDHFTYNKAINSKHMELIKLAIEKYKIFPNDLDLEKILKIKNLDLATAVIECKINLGDDINIPSSFLEETLKLVKDAKLIEPRTKFLNNIPVIKLFNESDQAKFLKEIQQQYEAELDSNNCLLTGYTKLALKDSNVNTVSIDIIALLALYYCGTYSKVQYCYNNIDYHTNNDEIVNLNGVNDDNLNYFIE
ncbi:MAG: hypothetical protein HRU35_06610 [Rickettsiaceae bacterium]|nr:hypothetical protein [Rickettsiaceae bacterium]